MTRLVHSLWAASLAALLVAPTFAQKTELLKYDDGSQESKRSMTGGVHVVRFECPDDQKWYVNAVRLHGSRYGAAQAPNEDFEIVIANDDFSKRQVIKKPYSLFKRGDEKWVRIPIDPVEVEGPFHVAAFFNPTRTKGVYVGIDTDSSPSHSATATVMDMGAMENNVDGDWMIRAYLTNEIEGEAKQLLDEGQRAEQAQEREIQMDKEIVGEARSLTLRQDDGPTDDHMNIQGALYTVEFETPQDVEGYVWQVQCYASQFGREHDSEAVSGDVYILDENRKILSRTTFPYSVSTQVKHWISIPTLPTRVKGKFYVSIDTHGTKFKGLYMGYQDGNPQGIGSTDARNGERIVPADWSKRFDNMQWLIRVKLADRPVTYGEQQE
ncbi:hypothetical protein NG895_01485 [Aeoliella sp. ICT_H6.2]|uniref:Uncharacterized protein n=1 Tax=Aeoliella straminimaris TaxID=2954799 RepID=A0A9X2JH64_9BACT|nr:hypothetical protein [Aeoliella straminimaris]MCO6042569.1 hypothetical protein [Aeoliella straminimaris]